MRPIKIDEIKINVSKKYLVSPPKTDMKGRITCGRHVECIGERTNTSALRHPPADMRVAPACSLMWQAG
ncbi:hypothetical protein X949_3514 [Burkholderia pseudomallei MSHR5609]|nr:hypothetical protein X949_3514 [Burkholderia pseudomallei MSHR5609]